MLRLLFALQSAGGVDAIPSTFDLKNQPPADVSAIIVTGRRRSQRIEREPLSAEPPLGRAEMGLFSKVKANVHVESAGMAGGATSQRVMVGVKIPF